jgi:hypothetical protein
LDVGALSGVGMSDSPSTGPVRGYRLLAGNRLATVTRDLSTLADALAQLGHHARADDALGAEWACWADWCWRAGATALPASPETARAFVEDVAGGMADADDLLDVIGAVSDRHRVAGHPDPFDGCAR